MHGASGLEVKFEEILMQLKLNYMMHYIFKEREYDFYLPDYKLLIETHGCFFHCCKEDGYTPKYPFQRKNIKNDKHKVNLVKFSPEYKLLVIWEHEITSRRRVVQKIHEALEGRSLLLNNTKP